MFSVNFEVCPRIDRWDDYFAHARLLRPELERVDGFIDNIRYRSLRRPGWVLSHSTWRDEKALIRWRTHAVHHGIQVRGRAEVFQDYRLRVGASTADTHPPAGHMPREHRLDETEIGAAKATGLVEAVTPGGEPSTIAKRLGLVERAEGLIEWDVFDSVLARDNHALLTCWRDTTVPDAIPETLAARRRSIHVIREYGMLDRREAVQYFPPL